MTDRDKLKKLLTDFGVGFEEEDTPYLKNCITCRQGRQKIDGYCMFFTAFEFNDDGSFKQMGAWE